MAVYDVDRRPPRLRRRDIPLEQLHEPRQPHPTGDQVQYVVGYELATGERQLIFSTTDLSTIRTHAIQPVVGFVTRDSQSQWTAYVWSLTSSQCTASLALPNDLLVTDVEISFSTLSDCLDIALPCSAWSQ